MWRNRESQQTPSKVSSGRVEASNAKVQAISGNPTGTTAHASWLSPTMGVKGEISGKEDLLVDGKVERSISVGEHRLTVGHNGQVSGGFAAREIIIYGKVEGNHSAVSESIEIKKDASVIGDVTTRRIMIEDGAHFKGRIEIRESSKQADSNVDNSVARTFSKSA